MLDIERADGITILRMAHGKANALDVEFLDELRTRLEAESEGDARALVLTAQGSIFSAGVDLRRILAEGEPYARRFVPALESCFEALFRFPKPMIAAINGHALAGGCIMACACDRRIAARTSLTIGVPELRVGVPFPLIALEMVRFAFPAAHVQEMVYSGRSFGVEEALERSIVDEAAPAEELMERALGRARELAAVPRDSFRLAKRMLRQPALDRLAAHGATFGPEVARVWASDEIRAAIQAYVDRTLRRGS